MERYEAKRPFNETELELVLRHSTGLTWNRRIETGFGTDYEPGFETVPDNTFVGRTCEVLLATAIHIRHLAKLTPASVSTFQRGRFLGSSHTIDWLRPKPQAKHRWVHTPVPDDMLPWVRDYLAIPKPRTEPAYLYLFRRLASRIEDEERLSIHINPLRFRHTGIVMVKHRFNLTDLETAELAGTTVATVQRYASEDGSRTLERIFSRGYSSVRSPSLPAPSSPREGEGSGETS